MEKYYISSSKYTIESRETKKNGVLYDIRFRVMETDTYRIVHKRLSGYKTKTAAREAYMDFVTKNCTLLKNADAVLKPDKQKEDPRIADLFSVYTTAIASQNKPGSIVDKKPRNSGRGISLKPLSPLLTTPCTGVCLLFCFSRECEFRKPLLFHRPTSGTVQFRFQSHSRPKQTGMGNG